MNQDGKLIPFRAQSEAFTVFRNEGCYYVDKTGVIPYIIERGDKICVVTRPRRFGKTLMLRMLQTFFEYRLDDDGKPVDNCRYFEGLNVMDAGEDVLRHMGQYPVISLSFKDIKADTEEMMTAQMRGAVRSACEPLESTLKNSGILSDVQLKTFQGYLDRTAAKDDLMQFLNIMTDWIYKATKRKTVILLDEYDVPLQQAAIYDMQHPGSELFEKMVRLVGTFISSGFKSNNNLAYGIIAGCMRVAKESIFTGMNNPGVISVLDNIPEEFWGFTESEVKTMLAYYGIEDQYGLLEQWYDGYEYSGRKVFNPWSVLNAIRGLVNGYGRDAIQSYWVRTSGNDIIDDMIDRNPEHRNALAKIINGAPMWVPVFQDLSYRELQTHPEAIWSCLLYTGYLKAIEKRQLDSGNWEMLITIPNKEVMSVMNQAMSHWWKDIHLAGYDAHNLMHAFWKGDIEGIEREIGTVLFDGVSIYDTKEDFYHGMMLGLLRTQCRVQSNREYGEGRPDIVAIQGHCGLILELKCILPSEMNNMPREEQFVKVPLMMNKLLDEAETQIKTRLYIEGLKFDEPTVAEVKAYAMCFCRKRCSVRLIK